MGCKTLTSWAFFDARSSAVPRKKSHRSGTGKESEESTTLKIKEIA